MLHGDPAGCLTSNALDSQFPPLELVSKKSEKTGSISVKNAIYLFSFRNILSNVSIQALCNKNQVYEHAWLHHVTKIRFPRIQRLS